MKNKFQMNRLPIWLIARYICMMESHNEKGLFHNSNICYFCQVEKKEMSELLNDGWRN